MIEQVISLDIFRKTGNLDKSKIFNLESTKDANGNEIKINDLVCILDTKDNVFYPEADLFKNDENKKIERAIKEASLIRQISISISLKIKYKILKIEKINNEDFVFLTLETFPNSDIALISIKIKASQVIKI